MKNFKLYIVIAAIIGATASLFMLAPSAEAVEIWRTCNGNVSSQVCASTSDNASVYIKRIINTLFFVLGAIAVVMIIISGIRYATSAGNATQVTAAKNTLLYSVIGLAVAIFAYAIVGFVVNQLVKPPM